MILFNLTETEDHAEYQKLQAANVLRQYDFLRSIVGVTIEMGRPFFSQQILKALNYHAIVCLHTNAGEYRPCAVNVGEYNPPAHFRLATLMDDFVNEVNFGWINADTVVLASFVLWRLNFIHPFINGNGRTARAACYYILCAKAGGWLSGETILPELLAQNRAAYVDALKVADKSYLEGGNEGLDLSALHNLLSDLLVTQTESK